MPEDAIFPDVASASSSIGLRFGFISCQVCSREIWLRIATPAELKEVAEYWVFQQTGLFLRMIKESRCSWGWIAKPAIKWRSGNVCGLDVLGMDKRKLLEIHHQAEPFGRFLGRTSRAYRAAVEPLCSGSIFYWIMEAKLAGKPLLYFGIFMPAAFRAFWCLPSFWLKCVRLALLPAPVVRGIQVIRRTLKPAT